MAERGGPGPAAGIPARDLLDGLGTAVVLLAPDDRVIYLNAAAEDLFALSAAQALGRRPRDWLAGDAGLETIIAKARDTGGAFAVPDLELATRAGQRLRVDLRVGPLESAGDRAGLVLEFVDAEPRRRARRDHVLSEAQALSRTLARQLAHEVKNPLSGMRGAAQLLERISDDPRARDYTGIIRREVDRLAELADRMLGPARAPRLERLNIHVPLERVIGLLQAEAPESVKLVRDYDPSLPELELDADQMTQALLNIARNALQAFEGSGTIIFRTRAASNLTLGGRPCRLAVLAEIIDDGPGVPEALRERLFFPLVTGRAEGTGLGLPLAQELIHRHGGQVGFASRPGHTVFSIALPVPGSS